jgi:hypothetical protein
MNRIVIGALAALMLVAAGVFWWQGRASDGAGTAAAPLAIASAVPSEAEDLPEADPGDMVGPGLPQANEATREQRRFDRLDKDTRYRRQQSAYVRGMGCRHGDQVQKGRCRRRSGAKPPRVRHDQGPQETCLQMQIGSGDSW